MKNSFTLMILTITVFIAGCSAETPGRKGKGVIEKEKLVTEPGDKIEKAYPDDKVVGNKEDEAEALKGNIWNKVCPVDGNNVGRNVPSVLFAGRRFGFCNSGCVEKFKTEPGEYVKNLSEDGTVFTEKK